MHVDSSSRIGGHPSTRTSSLKVPQALIACVHETSPDGLQGIALSHDGLSRLKAFTSFQSPITSPGITAGFVLYPFCKLVAGRQKEVRAGLWVLAALSLAFFVFYPYR